MDPVDAVFQTSHRTPRSPIRTRNRKAATCRSPDFDDATLSMSDKIDKMFDIMQQLPTLITKVSAISEELKGILSKVERLEDNYGAILKDVDNLKAQVMVSKSTSNQHSLDEIQFEMNDRLVRSKNIVMYNVPEGSTSHEDNQYVSCLIDELKPSLDKADEIKFMRLGKRRDNSSRPLKIVCSSQKDAFSLFNVRQKLKKPMAMSLDRTKAQRELLASVRKELDDRKKKGEVDITIKYVRGQPTITNLYDPKNA